MRANGAVEVAVAVRDDVVREGVDMIAVAGMWNWPWVHEVERGVRHIADGLLGDIYLPSSLYQLEVLSGHGEGTLKHEQ